MNPSPPKRPARAGLVSAAVAALALGVLPGCPLLEQVGLARNKVDPETVRNPPDLRGEPTRVVVRRVLVSFAGAGLRGVTRTRPEAEALARKVLALAQSGTAFADLVRLYSDDRHGDGTLALANWGVPTREDEKSRQDVASALARTAFALEPGGIGLVEYDKYDHPDGWSVVLRDR